MDLKSAVATLSKSGNVISDQRFAFGERPTNPMLDLNLEDAEFWQALDEVARAAKVRVVAAVTHNGTPAVGLRAADDKASAPVVCYSGPFRLVLKQTTAVRNLANPKLSQLHATVEVACEPRYRPFFFRVGKGSIKFQSADGAWIEADQGGVGQIRLLGEQPVDWLVRLPLPDRSVATLKGLQGEVVADVPPRMLAFVFSAQAGDQEATKEDVTARPTRFEVTADPRVWRVRLQLQYPAGEKGTGLDLESHQTWAMDEVRIVLRDKTGREWKPSIGPLFSIAEKGIVTVECAFADDFADSPRKTADWQLHVTAPATPLRVPVRFQFKDVPLP
jgi:hypothetical protein